MDVQQARARLEAICAELDRSVSVLAGAGGAAGLPGADRSEAIMAAARRQRLAAAAALERIDLGTYGTCADCRGQLPEGRLEALPAAARCVPCQARRDRQAR